MKKLLAEDLKKQREKQIIQLEDKGLKESPLIELKGLLS